MAIHLRVARGDATERGNASSNPLKKPCLHQAIRCGKTWQQREAVPKNSPLPLMQAMVADDQPGMR